MLWYSHHAGNRSHERTTKVVSKLLDEEFLPADKAHPQYAKDRTRRFLGELTTTIEPYVRSGVLEKRQILVYRNPNASSDSDAKRMPKRKWVKARLISDGGGIGTYAAFVNSTTLVFYRWVHTQTAARLVTDSDNDALYDTKKVVEKTVRKLSEQFSTAA